MVILYSSPTTLFITCLNPELLLDQNHNREKFPTGIVMSADYARDQSLDAAKNLHNFKLLLRKLYGHSLC